MGEYKLESFQAFSSLEANRYRRMLVTGLTPATAACTLAVSRASVWVLLTDTSGLGDAYTLKVTAE